VVGDALERVEQSGAIRAFRRYYHETAGFAHLLPPIFYFKKNNTLFK
jgi:hypothetical protein